MIELVWMLATEAAAAVVVGAGRLGSLDEEVDGMKTFLIAAKKVTFKFIYQQFVLSMH